MDQSKKVKDGALLTAVYIILMMISIFVPFMLIVGIFLLPIPFIIYAYQNDWKPSLIVLGFLILLSLIFIPYFSVPVTILVSFGGIMIGAAMYRNLSAYETWARGTLGFVAGLIFVFLFTQFFLEINWATEIDLLFNESLETSKEMMYQLGFEEEVEESLEIIEEGFSLLKDLIPVGLAVTGIFMALITQWISYKIINPLHKKQFYFPAFRSFRLPVSIVWFYFISMLITLFDNDSDSVLFIGASNVLALAGLFLVIQGFSFMFFYAHNKKRSMAFPIIGVIITLILPFYLLYFVRILGIIDIGFSLRDRLTKK